MKSGPKQIVRMGGFMDKDAKKNQIPLTREQKARMEKNTLEGNRLKPRN